MSKTMTTLNEKMDKLTTIETTKKRILDKAGTELANLRQTLVQAERAKEKAHSDWTFAKKRVELFNAFME